MAKQEQAVGSHAQELVENRMADTLANLTEVAAYRYPGEKRTKSADPLVFSSNKALFEAILKGTDATENCRVELQGFWLTEWTPLRPGRFHTRDARYARSEAMRNSMIREDDERAPQGLCGVVAMLRGRPYTRIFYPGGKMRMVDGGIGCVRLKPLPNREVYRWAFGASSSAIVHQGALVALSDDDHDRLIGDVRRSGGLYGTLKGTLRFVPRGDLTERMFGRGIPQIYIEVDHFEPERRDGGRAKSIDVTAAVTFTSRGEDYPGLNVSYVTFNAARRGDLDRAVDWLDMVMYEKPIMARSSPISTSRPRTSTRRGSAFTNCSTD